jgi:hypothetical protein
MQCAAHGKDRFASYRSESQHNITENSKSLMLPETTPTRANRFD